MCGVLGLPTDEELKSWGENVVKWIAEGLGDFRGELRNIFITPIEDFWVELTKKYRVGGEDGGKGYLAGIKDGVDTAKDSLIVQAFNGVVSKVRSVLGLDKAKGEMDEIGEDSSDGYFKGLEDGVATAKDSWIAKIGKNILGAFGTVLGIASPSKEFMKLGGYCIDGLKEGISEKWGEIETFFTNSLPNVKSIVTNAWDDLKTKTSTAWDGIKSTLSTSWESIKSTATSVWDNIKQKISGNSQAIDQENVTKATNTKDKIIQIYEAMNSGMKSILDKMKTSATSAWENITSTTQSKVNSMQSQLSSSFNNIFSDISNQISRIKNLMNFTWSLPKPKIPHISWSYSYVQNGDGSSLAIPQFYVNWYAKGGVFDVSPHAGRED